MMTILPDENLRKKLMRKVWNANEVSETEGRASAHFEKRALKRRNAQKGPLSTVTSVCSRLTPRARIQMRLSSSKKKVQMKSCLINEFSIKKAPCAIILSRIPTLELSGPFSTTTTKFRARTSA